MWAVLIGAADRDRALDALGTRYDVEPGRLRADLDAFEQRCIAQALLAPAGAPAAADADEPPPEPAEPTAAVKPARFGRARFGPARFGAPTMLAALRSLIATQRALSRDGFRATYERYAALPATPDTARVARAVASFVRAENLFVTRRAPDDCLVRSLALYRFLRAAGIPAEHVIGVQRFPFQAHAWVECDGAVVLDDRQRRQRFTPLARLGTPAATTART